MKQNNIWYQCVVSLVSTCQIKTKYLLKQNLFLYISKLKHHLYIIVLMDLSLMSICAVPLSPSTMLTGTSLSLLKHPILLSTIQTKIVLLVQNNHHDGTVWSFAS
jgi:hypothetical protein